MLKKAIILSGIGIISVMIILPFAIFDRNPIVIKTEDVDPTTTHKAKQLLKKTLSTLNSDRVDRSITLSYEQVSSLMALISHALPMVSARINKIKGSWLIYVTIKVPKIKSLYINASTNLVIGEIDLPSTMIEIGSISISLNTFLELAIGLINYANKEGDDIDHTRVIKKVTLEQDRIITNIHPEFQLEQFKVSVKSSGKQVIKQLALGQDDSIAINHYLKLLDKMSASTDGIDGLTISLSDYVAPLFHEVRRKSANSNPSKENQYALFALIYFTGDSLIRKIIKNTYAPNIKNSSSNSKTVLQQRHDLVLHFIYSATIEIITNAETSIRIGEIKELSDANKGGSGYSFVDLLADTAGIHFAKSISDPLTAEKMQHKLSSIRQEEDFFPSIAGLPEGLNEAELKEQFGDTDSKAFKMIKLDIDQRIKSRKIYQ